MHIYNAGEQSQAENPDPSCAVLCLCRADWGSARRLQSKDPPSLQIGMFWVKRFKCRNYRTVMHPAHHSYWLGVVKCFVCWEMVLDYFYSGEMKVLYGLLRANNIKQEQFSLRKASISNSCFHISSPFTKKLNRKISYLDIKSKIHKYKQLGFQQSWDPDSSFH